MLSEDGLAIFHCQNVVGTFQQGTGQTHGLQRTLTGGGEGLAGCQLLPESGREVLAQKCLGGGKQFFGVRGLCPKAQAVTQPGENGHAAGGKALCRG